METENTNQTENSEVTPEVTPEVKNDYEVGDGVYYTLKEIDKETHNLYGQPKIMARIKSLEPLTIVIPNYGSIELEGIVIENVTPSDLELYLKNSESDKKI